MAERFVLGNYFVASMVVAGGLFVYYGFLAGLRSWFASPEPMALFWIMLSGLIAVICFVAGLAGFLLRYDREARFLDDQIVLPSEWKFEKSETVIPIERVWKLYSNLKNDFPCAFIVWKDELGRCRRTMFDKDEVEDFPDRVARLGERIPVDSESYAIADFVRKDVPANLGCELA